MTNEIGSEGLSQRTNSETYGNLPCGNQLPKMRNWTMPNFLAILLYGNELPSMRDQLTLCSGPKYHLKFIQFSFVIQHNHNHT